MLIGYNSQRLNLQTQAMNFIKQILFVIYTLLDDV